MSELHNFCSTFHWLETNKQTLKKKQEMQDKSCSQALCYSPNTLCHGRRVMLHLRHNKNRMWLKERQTKWASKSPMCLRRAANDGTSECWHTAGAHPPNPHPTHPPNSKRTGGGTAASVNTPQSTEWVMYDLGLSVCAVPIATWNAGYVSWIFFCVTGWGDGRRVRVGGWVGGCSGQSEVTCVSMFNLGSRSDIWFACLTAISQEGEQKPPELLL